MQLHVVYTVKSSLARPPALKSLVECFVQSYYAMKEYEVSGAVFCPTDFREWYYYVLQLSPRRPLVVKENSNILMCWQNTHMRRNKSPPHAGEHIVCIVCKLVHSHWSLSMHTHTHNIPHEIHFSKSWVSNVARPFSCSAMLTVLLLATAHSVQTNHSVE